MFQLLLGLKTCSAARGALQGNSRLQVETQHVRVDALSKACVRSERGTARRNCAAALPGKFGGARCSPLVRLPVNVSPETPRPFAFRRPELLLAAQRGGCVAVRRMTPLLVRSLEAENGGCVGCTRACGSTGSCPEAEVGVGWIFLKAKGFIFDGFSKAKGLGFSFLTWHDFGG